MMTLTRRKGLVVMIALMSLLVSALPVHAQSPQPQLFPPTGPYAIGRTSYEWIDATRPEVHTEDEDDVRALAVEVWYPAEWPDYVERAPIMPPELAAFFEDVNSLPRGMFLAIRANAVYDAPLASAQGTYPVVIFDPGFSASVFQYSVMIEELASHGYVVIGMSHPYATALTVYPDGRAVAALGGDHLRSLWVPRDIYDGELEGAWLPDTRLAVAQIAALNDDDPNGLFTGRLDTARYGMIGHSQGARTISEICYLDARCAGAINLDGSYSAEVDLGMDRPYMIMLADNGVEDLITTFQTGLESLGAGFYALMIPRTHHNSFMDTAFWASLVMDEPPEGVGAAQIAVMDYRLYATAFFDRHLRGLDVPLLDGASPEHPEVFYLDRQDMIAPVTAHAEPQIASPGANQGAIAVGAADVWLYEGTAGELLDIMALAERPADGANSEQRVDFDLLDTLLVVRAPDGSLLAANDDMLSRVTNSALRELRLPVDGEYRIEVRSWANKTGGAYTLVITSRPGDGRWCEACG